MVTLENFHRLFKEALGITPKAYAAANRMGRARDGLIRAVPGATLAGMLDQRDAVAQELPRATTLAAWLKPFSAKPVLLSTVRERIPNGVT